MAAMTDYLENKLIDFLFRAQTFVPPATLYIALFTVSPTDASGGTEVTGGNYARVPITNALANWAGTQGAATTAVSSGTSGLTSNNGAITFGVPSAAWGSVVSVAIMDASSAGNMWFEGALTAPKTVNNGDPAPVFNAATMTLTIDN